MALRLRCCLLAVVALGLLAPTAPARQHLRASRIRAPRNQPDPAKAAEEGSPGRAKGQVAGQPWDQRTERRPVRVPEGRVFPGIQPHDREHPTFYNDPNPRIWNDDPGFGAGMPMSQRRRAVRPDSRPSPTAELLGPGGLRARIQGAIRRGRAIRYQQKLKGVKLMEQYRAEKALLGLCPVDACEKPRFIIEGKNFAPEGYCEEHSVEFYGKRVDWAIQAAVSRGTWRDEKRQEFYKRWHTGARFSKGSHLGDTSGLGAADARAAIGQPPLPEAFPRPGDLGPVGTLPMFADPRDPAGYPYNAIDPDPDPFHRPGEQNSWVRVSKMAPR